MSKAGDSSMESPVEDWRCRVCTWAWSCHSPGKDTWKEHWSQPFLPPFSTCAQWRVRKGGGWRVPSHSAHWPHATLLGLLNLSESWGWGTLPPCLWVDSEPPPHFRFWMRSSQTLFLCLPGERGLLSTSCFTFPFPKSEYAKSPQDCTPLSPSCFHLLDMNWWADLTQSIGSSVYWTARVRLYPQVSLEWHRMSTNQ